MVISTIKRILTPEIPRLSISHAGLVGINYTIVAIAGDYDTSTGTTSEVRVTSEPRACEDRHATRKDVVPSALEGRLAATCKLDKTAGKVDDDSVVASVLVGRRGALVRVINTGKYEFPWLGATVLTPCVALESLSTIRTGIWVGAGIILSIAGLACIRGAFSSSQRLP